MSENIAAPQDAQPGPTQSVRAEDSSILGAHLVADGCDFALWAPRATRVELALLELDRTQQNFDMTQQGDGTWVVHVPGVTAGQLYGYRVHGEWNPNRGMRFNPAKLLLDPYARAITAGVDYLGPIRDHTAESNYQPDTRDSAPSVPLGVVVADTDAPTPIARRRPMSETVIYETHVSGYTRTHPLVPEHLRGTYGGLAYPAVVEHLVHTGVTAVQLLPIHHFVSEPFVVGKGLVNFWGYNTLGFFAPHAAYSSMGTTGEQVLEFRQMVSTLHEAGIEVILDVVYNHTGEGGHEGPTLSYRGIDHGAYYRLTQDLHNDYDVTGCGNSVDTSQPAVLDLVLDSMRYWVTEMGVDGFRFDLATTLIRDAQHHVDQNHAFKQAIASDPVFEGIKMIAEPWDVGPFGYQVGNWGPGWTEHNDHFRDHLRDFWRGATHGVRELATRMAGSPDVYQTPGRDATAGINFVAVHDGFTLRDVVSYDVKHNDANGESNRDGSDNNHSWNHGWEGDTDDEQILELRHRQIKNLMLSQVFAVGVPMLLAGDEIGRTQRGNNNAYCQDSPISWVHWEMADEWADITRFTARALQLRAAEPLLRRPDYHGHDDILDADGEPTGRYRLAWLNGDMGEMGDADWADPARRTLGMYLADEDSAFIIWLHGGADPLDLVMPPVEWGAGHEVLLNSWSDEEPTEPIVLAPGEVLPMPGRSSAVVRVHLAPAEAQPDTVGA